MYNKNLIIKKIKNGEGVFSNIVIPAKKPIIQFKGNIYTKDNIKNINDVIQIGTNKYLGMSGEIDDKIRTSCSPSAYLSLTGNRVILYSIFEIRPSIEITYDFSVSCLDKDLSTNCYCSGFKCRGKLRDYNSIPEEIKKKYLFLNIVPMYIKYNFFKKV